MRRLLYRIPIVGRVAWRRHVAAVRAETDGFRRDAALRSAAVARILAEAPHVPDSWRSMR